MGRRRGSAIRTDKGGVRPPRRPALAPDFLRRLEPRLLLAAGDPDPTFGTAGVALLDGGALNEAFNDVAEGPGGTLVAAGTAVSTGDALAARFLAAGQPDPAFGAGGLVTIDIATVLGLASPVNYSDTAAALVTQPGGKVVVAGTTAALSGATSGDFYLLRLNSDGTIDRAFGNNGVAVADFGGRNDTLNGLTVAPDGALVAIGRSGDDSAVARFTADGQLDTTFGPDATGLVLAPATYGGAAVVDYLSAVAVRPDGRVVAVGVQNNASGYGIASLLQLLPDGRPDPAFSTAGRSSPEPSAQLASVVLQPDGRIVAGGNGGTVHRFTATGQLDPTFDGDGRAALPVGISGTTRDVALAPDGKIVAAFRPFPATWSYDTPFRVFRLLPDGYPDPTFGTGGAALIESGRKVAATNAVVIQSDGQIVIAGAANDAPASTSKWDLALARVDGTSAPNVPPTAVPGGPYEVAEGGGIWMNALKSADPDGHVRLYEWDFDYDGSAFAADAAGPAVVFDAVGIDGPTTRTVALRVTDGSDAATIATTTLQVVNAAPTLLVTGPVDAAAGQPYTLALSAGDPGFDTLSQWRIDWGDGTVQTLPGTATAATHTFARSPRRYRVAVTATDEDGTWAASNGPLDPTFGGGGMAQADPGYRATGAGAAIDPVSGKVYAATSYYESITRFNRDGSPDTTWGNNGTVSLPYGENQAGSLLVQPDGKLLYCGASSVALGVIRLTRGGELDPAFGLGGTASVRVGGQYASNTTRAMALQPDGRIVVVGETNTPSAHSLAVARFNPDGTLDTGFGTGGTVAAHVGPSYYSDGAAVAIQPDGKIVIVLGDSWLSVVRLNADGTFDTTFGPDGTGHVILPAPPEAIDNRFGRVALQGDGKILTGGTLGLAHLDTTDDYVAMGAARLNPDGTLDSTYGAGGWSIVLPNGREAAFQDLILAPDGGLLMAGTSPTWDYTDAVLVKLTPGGALDRSFAGGGVVTSGFAGVAEGGYALALGDGEIVVVGRRNVPGGYDTGVVALRYRYGDLVVRENETPILGTVPAGTVDEAAPYTLSGTLADRDLDDAHDLVIDWGDGTLPARIFLPPGATAWSASHVYPDDNPTGTAQDVYTIRITADDGLAKVEQTTTVTVKDVAPVVDAGPDRAGPEGTALAFSATVSDAGKADTFTYRWTVAAPNGQAVPVGTYTTFSFTPNDNGAYYVTLTVTDDDGVATSDTVRVDVANVDPAVNLASDSTVNEGTSYTRWAVISDPGSADVLTRRWTVTSTNGQQVADSSGPYLTFTPIDEGVYTVTLTVTDDDGGVGSDSFVLTVNNVAPRLGLGTDTGWFVGTYFLPLSATDPGADTITAWDIDWGDGRTQTLGGATYTTHDYTAPGRYTISATATDEDGTWGPVTKTLTISPQIVMTPGGGVLVTGTEYDDTAAAAVSAQGGLTITLNGTVTALSPNITRIDFDLLGDKDTLTYTGDLPGGSVNLGAGDDVFRIDSGVSTDPLAVLGGAGKDELRVAAGVVRPFSYDGGAGPEQDAVYLTTGATADTIDVLPAALAVTGGTRIDLADVEYRSVSAGGGADLLRLGDTPANTTTVLSGDADNDTFEAGTPGAAYAWAGFASLSGGGGFNTVLVDDRGATAGHAYALSGYQLSRDGWAAFSLGTFSTITLRAGPSADVIDVSPATSATLYAHAGDPAATAPGDRLNLLNYAPRTAYIARTGPDSGRYTFNGTYLAVEFSGVEQLGPPDTAPPTIATRTFRRGARPEVQLTFSEDVRWSLAADDLVVTRLDTGQRIDPALLTLSVSGGLGLPTVATWRAIAPLPDGNYRATLPAGAVADAAGNPLAAPDATDFFVLAGDVNGDRAVNATDLRTLYANLGRTPADWSQGDLDGDGSATFADYQQLELTLGHALPAPAPAAPSPAPAPVTAEVLTTTSPATTTASRTAPAPAPPRRPVAPAASHRDNRRVFSVTPVARPTSRPVPRPARR